MTAVTGKKVAASDRPIMALGKGVGVEFVRRIQKAFHEALLS